MVSLTSPKFIAGGTIPPKYTQEGDNISPPLEWSGFGDKVQEIALVCEDLYISEDDPVVLWTIYGIDAQNTRLSEGVEVLEEVYKPVHARQGLNSEGGIGYTGPFPPIEDDWHIYRFKIFGLNKKLDLHAGVNRDDFYVMINRHKLEEAELRGKYHCIKRLQEFPLLQRAPENPDGPRLRQ